MRGAGKAGAAGEPRAGGWPGLELRPLGCALPTRASALTVDGKNIARLYSPPRGDDSKQIPLVNLIVSAISKAFRGNSS